MPPTRSERCEALDRAGSQPIEFEKINTYYWKAISYPTRTPLTIWTNEMR